MKKLLLLLLVFTLAFSMMSCFLLEKPEPDPTPTPDGPGTNQENPDNNNPDQNDPDKNDPDQNNPGSEVENATAGSEKIINVYLIAGQSNAVGYGMDTNKTIANSDPRFVQGFDNVLYYASLERWGGAAVDVEFQPVTLGLGVAADRSGAEIGIASAIADNGEMNAIIKCAQGATHLYPDTQYDVSINYGTWTSPSYIEKYNLDLSENAKIGYMYTRFENTVKDGLELLIAEGYTPVIKGVWWMQGEAEMFTITMASAYKELYETLINDTRNMLSQVTGYDCSETPFICGLPKWNTNNSPAPTYQETVRQAMKTVAGSMTNVGYVDCMPLNQHDDWHFDAQGQKTLGEKFIEGLAEFDGEEIFETKLSVDNEIKLVATNKGLEFRANLTDFDPADKYQYGFIIVPTEKLGSLKGNYIAELDKAGVAYKNISATVKVDKLDETYSDVYFTAKLDNIAYADLNTAFTAIAYVKNEYGAYLYSSRYLSDSIARLASVELYKEGADVEALQKIVNAGINFLNGTPEESAENDPGLELICDDVNLFLSESRKPYQLQVTKSQDVDYFVRYSSENPEIATVDQNGVIKTHALGSTFIVVECAGKTKKIQVTVEAFNKDGVTFDGVISNGEYIGDFITDANSGVAVNFAGMTKNGNLYLAFELIHGEWSPLHNSWWFNDNLEIKVNDGTSYTVVFYEGVATYSKNISYGISKTEELGDKLVTVVELCIENVDEANRLKVGFNGTNFGWLGTIWHDELNRGYVTAEGIKVKQPINMGNGLVLDGSFDEAVYTENVKNNVLYANGNGANVEILGTLIDKGVLLGVTVYHNMSNDVSLGYPYDWFTYMNIEIHFNSSDTQFIAIANNVYSWGEFFTYCKTVPNGAGYISTFEIFVPYESIGVNAGVESVSFTARGWFETGWCDLLNNSWEATHKISANGISVLN